MKKNFLFTICMISFFLMPLHSDPLWEKAVAFVSTGGKMPGTITEIEKVYNGKSLLQTEETRIEVVRAGDGYELELVKKTKNRKDITKKYAKTFEKEKLEFDFDLYYLFSRGNNKEVSYEKTGVYKEVRGYNSVEYRFTFKQDEALLMGTVYLEEKSGCPLELKAEMKSVPFEKEGIVVKKMEYVTSYGYAAGGPLIIEKTDLTSIFAIKGFDYDLKSETEYIYSGY